jgi:predicted transcriptional regulator
MSDYKPTDSELDILQILWKEGEVTVRRVNELQNAAAPAHEMGYTTTLKMMQIMHEKGLVTRRAEGKTHYYSAHITQTDTRQTLVNRLAEKAFGGSALSLAMQALGGKKASKSELDEIRRFLDTLEAE